MMKKTYLTLITLFITALSFGQTIAAQDFESLGSDTWVPVIAPATYNVSGDVWATVASLSSISPQSGSNFWGMQDLNNGNGGGAFDHTLAFPNWDVTGKTGLSVSFYYHTIGFDSTDTFRVEFFINDVSQGEEALSKDTAGAMVLYTKSIPDGTLNVRFTLLAFQNGGSDYAGVDNIILEENAAPPCTVTLDAETFTCNSNTAGDDNDSVTVNIPYTGSDATITSVTTTSGGTVGGDDPASVSNGTITITGLSEGSAWDVTLNGGNCDTNTVSGTVPSAQCDPLAMLVINEILADPDGATGDANGDGSVSTTQDEFVEIYNMGATSVDLENYTLSDGVAVRHTFTSTVLGINNMITIFGGGAPTGVAGVVQTASSGSLGLNNGGDTVTLKNSDGFTVATYTYGSEGGANQSLAREPDYTGAFVQHNSHTTNPIQFSPGAENNGILLSNNSNEIENFTVYPNPVVDGRLTINTMGNAAKAIQIFNVLGKQVFATEIQENGAINVESLNTGVYILKVVEEGKTSTSRLLIE
ncbi:MAG: lamin tail domain-containing protein [Urechidicola sp.]|nr:lamin tail domain-containing protein [Urechidicola sp.]